MIFIEVKYFFLFNIQNASEMTLAIFFLISKSIFTQ